MKKILLISFFTVVIIAVCVLFGFFSLVPDLQTPPDSTVEKLIFANQNTLFLKRKSDLKEGLAVISTSSNLEFLPDTSTDFIYDVSNSPLLYKMIGDSLIIYTRKLSKVPDRFKSKVKIRQIELNNPSMMNLIENKKYIKLNIKKIE